MQKERIEEEKKWVCYPTENCPACGNDYAMVKTSAEQYVDDLNDVRVNDGDYAECVKCGHEGVIIVEDSECADVFWYDTGDNEEEES